jgi:hypothetical protein
VTGAGWRPSCGRSAITAPDALGETKSRDIVTLRVYNVPNKTHRIERVRVGATE